jgi:hypothetical protein
MDQSEEIAFYTENAGTYNCYAFALGAKDGTYGHPGAASGEPLKSLGPTEMDAALRNDGLIPAKHEFGEMPEAREGFYLVAAVASLPTSMGRTGVGDYHFYRQMPDGSWWHDPGKLAPVNTDTEGRVITNPELAGRDYTKGTIEGNSSRESGYDTGRANYSVFVGYYYAPDTGLPVAPGSIPQEMMETPEMKKERERQAMMTDRLERETGGHDARQTVNPLPRDTGPLRSVGMP